MSASRPATQRAVKIDVDTDRRIAQLAYFMDVPKKAVVREAVAEYAEARLPRAGAEGGAGAGAASASASASPERAGGRGDAGERGDTGGQGGRASGDAGDAGPRVETPSEATALTFEDLPVRDRLALSRTQLIREFAARGGTGVRVVVESEVPAGDETEDEEEWSEWPETVELLVDTRLEDGSGAVVALGGIARSILRADVDVTSLTAIRLFSPYRLDDLMARSQPL